jgi:hypothetical protein
MIYPFWNIFHHWTENLIVRLADPKVLDMTIIEL